MRKCKACGGIWCEKCVRDGKGSYPQRPPQYKQIPAYCPHCGSLNKGSDTAP